MRSANVSGHSSVSCDMQAAIKIEYIKNKIHYCSLLTIQVTQ
jgi:hypothetical protein